MSSFRRTGLTSLIPFFHHIAPHGLIRDLYTNLPKDIRGIEALDASKKFPDQPDASDIVQDFDMPFNIGQYFVVGQHLKFSSI